MPNLDSKSFEAVSKNNISEKIGLSRVDIARSINPQGITNTLANIKMYGENELGSGKKSSTILFETLKNGILIEQMRIDKTGVNIGGLVSRNIIPVLDMHGNIEVRDIQGRKTIFMNGPYGEINVGTKDVNGFIFVKDGNEKDSIILNGNKGSIKLGIGEYMSNAGLEINSGSKNEEAILLNSSGDGWGSGIKFYNTKSGGKNYGIYSGFGDFHFVDVDNNKDRIVIKKDGKVGIGTNTPHYNLDVNGTINAKDDVIVGGADCAEEFDIADSEVDNGTVMVIDDNGKLKPSQKAYDKRVAGVISGAGNYRPGIILDKQPSKANRQPIALVGKTFCKVDAKKSPIEVGDLLTTSKNTGHAMKADDPFKAFGSVIGKALNPLEEGRGMIPILIALQ